MQPFVPSSGFLTAYYDYGVVALSLLIAMLASFVTLDLARRVRSTQRGTSRLWWGAGSVVMGTGIWSMHFLGMQAFSLPITLGYTAGLTLLSWVAAVAASAIALGIASQRQMRRPSHAIGALSMGLGITAMHYMGMAALDMIPPIIWDWGLVALSVGIAVAASAIALLIFQLMLKVRDEQRLRYQLLAALLMGLAICGMHYTGMAAASFPWGALCLSADALGGPSLTTMVVIASSMLLTSTLITSVLDARLQNTAQRLTQSLQESNDRLQLANVELQKRASTDPLTGLPNRLLLEERLAQALRALAGGRRLAVLFIDLDGFKPINDSFGHAAGDQLLTQVAARLRQITRERDTVARVGGDEFLLLLEDVNDASDALAMAERLQLALAQPFEVVGKQVQISSSIGLVVHPDQGQAEKLVAQADAAMYAAKRGGGSRCMLFAPHMDADATDQLQLLGDLRQAMERGGLALHYQPKVHGTDQRLQGVEALLRWQHPERGAIGPDTFIPLAERFGLINSLGNWVIEEACRQIRAWADDGLALRVAINLSVYQLREPGLADRIAGALRRHGVEAQQLLCEITESAAMDDIQATRRTFDELERIGVYLSIDDFGTGHSSLNYLRQLPAQQLKIDRSFVHDLEHSHHAQAVVEAVIGLAHALQLQVVAEGVETPGQRDLLLAMGCDELQGYLFARPMPAADLLDWTQRQPAPALQA